MLYAFWPKYKNGNVTTKSLPPYLLIMLTGLITFIGYYLSIKYYKPALDWSNLGYIFYFQPAKLVGYIAVFVLGIYGRQQQWFTKAGWKPGRIYLVMAVLSIILFIYWRFILISTANQSFDSIIDSLSYSLVSLCVPFGIIAVFINKATITYQYPLSLFSPYSYGIYWLHLIIAVLIMQYLSETDLNIVIKWILSVLMTLIISTLLTKLVLKKRIFIDDRHIQR